MTFREENPALFQAVNLLKAGGILYERYNPREYALLVENQEAVDHILEFDDCYMWVSGDFHLACIRFHEEEGTGFTNRLRVRFTLSEMKLYVCLDRLYTREYIAQGPFVTVSLEDVIAMFEELDLHLASKKDVSKRQLLPLIQNMAKYNLISRNREEDELVINPGIRFGIDRESFRRLYADVIQSWAEGGDADES